MDGPELLITLQPGGISKPSRVWCSSTSFRIGFYQAHPISPSFNIFYKKAGSVFGSEITTLSSAILGPDLSVKQPTSIASQYFEMEIRKLSPNTQYLIKVKTTNDRVNARSDKIATISVDEQRTRDSDMTNFGGALVKLNEYDGSIVKFERETGLFHVRILQIDDVVTATQLVRLQSEYSDGGLQVNAYTLSQIRFGRGIEINSSKIVPEGELKWIVARAVQMEERSESQEGYDARMQVLKLQTEKMQTQLQQESLAQMKKLRMRNLLYMVLASCLALLLLAGTTYVYLQATWRQRSFNRDLFSARGAVSELQAQVEQLHLYRLSLELDAAWRRTPGDNCSTWHATLGEAHHTTAAAAAAAAATAVSGLSGGVGNATVAGGGAPQQQRGWGRRKGVVGEPAGKGGGSSSGGGGGSTAGGGRSKAGSAGSGKATRPPAGAVPPEAKRWMGEGQRPLMGDAQMKKMLRRSHRLPSEFAQGSQWAGAELQDEPQAWSFIHQVSNQYALYVQEWMKVQLSKTIRSKVNEMLVETHEEGDPDDLLEYFY